MPLLGITYGCDKLILGFNREESMETLIIAGILVIIGLGALPKKERVKVPVKKD